MQNQRNYYRLLNVQFDAPAAVIKASYRTMMQKLKMHPDLGGNEEQARLLNEALNTLLDQHKRLRYDEQLKAKSPESFAQRFTRKSFSNESAVNDKTFSDINDEKPIRQTAKPAESCTFTGCEFCGHESAISPYTNLDWESKQQCSVCTAPLQKVSVQPVLVGKDQRQVTRHQFGDKVVVKTSWPDGECISAEIQDFSIKGTKVRLQCEVKDRQVLLLKSQHFDAVGQVRHKSQEMDGSWLIGIEFKTLETKMPPGNLFTATV